MRIVLCHNYYQQPGGEDQVFADEAELLVAHGHKVVRHTVHNNAIAELGRWSVAAKAVWNRVSYREIESLLKRERPDVIHFTNTFPLISPAAYYAAKNAGVPVVQSLHNYRLLCPGGIFHRSGQVCEDCLGKLVPWPAVQHGCYRADRRASAVVATMVTLHRLLKTWQKCVDRFIALSHFSAAKFVTGGLPAHKIAVKPNFISPDPGAGPGTGGYALFVGRLSAEKGIATLLDAWEHVGGALPLKILGDGPLASLVEERCQRNPHIAWLGRRTSPEVLQHLSEATCLIMPSAWYECCPKTLIESLAVGTPAVVSRLGAMAEMIDHERTGLHFTPGDALDLAARVRRLVDDPGVAVNMRPAARQEYADKYMAAANYQQLMEIYTAVARRPIVATSLPRTRTDGRELTTSATS
jgi:glycosyltransferase involved in cell wall biosynthesis